MRTGFEKSENNENGKYKEKYFKLNSKFESDKNLLIKLRKTTNKLKLQLDKLSKKDILYNELYEKNKIKINNYKKITKIKF